MKKHLQIVAGIFLLLATSRLFAQDNNDAIHQLAQSLRSHKNIEVTFTYQTLGDPDVTEKANDGTAYFQDEAYKIIMEDQHTISNGTTTWHYIIEDEEVMVGNAKDDDTPFQILDQLEKDNSGIKAVIDQKGNLKKLEVEIDEGVTLILNITEMKFDQDFPKGFFSFDEKAYPNVDIIDMR